MNEELSALVFELQRAGSKVDKAKALARAWRTIRGLSKVERRLLVREVGFDGAEDLIEGLAGEGRGVFAPAAVLEALGKMRREEGLSLQGLLSDLRDPERRDDLLVRGIDLVADSVVRPDEAEGEPAESLVHDRAVEADDDDLVADVDGPGRGGDPLPVPPIPPAAPVPRPEPGPRPKPRPRPKPGPRPKPERRPEPEPRPAPELERQVEPEPQAEEPSPWDSMWQPVDPLDASPDIASPVIESRPPMAAGGRQSLQQDRRHGSTLGRLRRFREGVETLRGAGVHRLREALEALPEPWARRRALVALIDAGLPDDAGSVLELIEGLDREMDRRWCLSALARRGDLTGADLDRALGLLSSPAARRRVVALARG
ncbi:MAG: hypothetical protein AB1Z65_15845 [Candidatus Sulfomarinibacteraceae bacterium]